MAIFLSWASLRHSKSPSGISNHEAPQNGHRENKIIMPGSGLHRRIPLRGEDPRERPQLDLERRGKAGSATKPGFAFALTVP
jgi:hypothetical protein